MPRGSRRRAWVDLYQYFYWTQSQRREWMKRERKGAWTEMTRGRAFSLSETTQCPIIVVLLLLKPQSALYVIPIFVSLSLTDSLLLFHDFFCHSPLNNDGFLSQVDISSIPSLRIFIKILPFVRSSYVIELPSKHARGRFLLPSSLWPISRNWPLKTPYPK